jgi:Family of unknown function (DUF6412)
MVASRVCWELMAALWHVLGAAPGRPGELLAGTAVAVALLLAAAVAARLSARTVPTPAVAGAARPGRERALRNGISRYTDPDAPGRPRPRAPSAAPVAAYTGLPGPV